MHELTFSGLWHINETFADRMRGVILPRLAAGIDPIPSRFMPAGRLNAFDEDDNYIPEAGELNRGLIAGGNTGVAVIDISGTMSRNGFCGYGNDFTRSVLELADKTPEVKGIVLKFNTPGGTVDSTDILADAVRGFSKPIISYVASMAASAGYFVASQADVIVMEDSISAEVGSIGVLMVYTDIQKHLEKEGMEVTIFRAGESIDKARVNGVEPLTDELRAEIQADLDAAMKAFKGYVKRGRAGKLVSDEMFTGKMYNKKQALSLGLADKVGTLKDAIKLAL